VNCVRFCFWRRPWLFLFVYEISSETLNTFAPNSQRRRVWSLSRTSLNVKVKGQRSRLPGTKKRGFRRPACGLCFGKNTFAVVFGGIWNMSALLNGFAPNSQGRHVWSLAWTSLYVNCQGQFFLIFNLFISRSHQLKHHKTYNKKQMTRPEWRVQGEKPLTYSHINSHNIHTLLDGKSCKITICQVWRTTC